MKKQWLLGGLLVSTFALAACGGNTEKTESTGSESTAEQSIKIAVDQEMPSADLSLATDRISFSALNNVYEGLYRVNAENKVEPAGAAELAEVSEDGLVYKLKLREDAKWSNGDSVTAADYVYGWQRTVTPETASEYAYLFEPVANAAEISAGKAEPSTLGIKAVGDYELEITLNVATPYFDFLLAFPSFFPQHEATVTEKGDQYAQTSDDSVYNGPFVLENFDGPGIDTEWTYQKNDAYWDADNVQLDTIDVIVAKESATGLNMFQDGQVNDVMLTGELAQQNANEPTYVVDKESRTTYFEMNQRESDSPFNNVNLRKALSYAIDRETMVKQVLGDGSVASTSLIPSGMSFDPTNEKDFVEESAADLTYDVDKAKEYWAKAKEELGIDKLEFEFVADDTDSTRAVAQYLQGAWQDTLDGVTAKLAIVPFSVRLDRGANGEFDVILGGWGADYADPSSFTDLFVTGNPYNRGQWSNPEYDKLIKKAATTNATDPTARWQTLLDAEKIVMDDFGVIPIYQRASGHLRSENVKNIVVHGSGATYDYKWAFVE